MRCNMEKKRQTEGLFPETLSFRWYLNSIMELFDELLATLIHWFVTWWCVIKHTCRTETGAMSSPRGRLLPHFQLEHMSKTKHQVGSHVKSRASYYLLPSDWIITKCNGFYSSPFIYRSKSRRLLLRFGKKIIK